jgi:TfoX/Sxy family transcriptional regulator of competence genes
MAYNEILAQRVRAFLASQPVVEEKKMMGGLCFMVDGKMCTGITKDDLMLRLSPEDKEMAMQRPGCREMDFTGRPLKGFVFVSGDALAHDVDLHDWIRLALKFNPQAQASKPRKRA